MKEEDVENRGASVYDAFKNSLAPQLRPDFPRAGGGHPTGNKLLCEPGSLRVVPKATVELSVPIILGVRRDSRVRSDHCRPVRSVRREAGRS